MSNYVDLILAVMMQESSGQGTDPMQSSEGAYNTQYPQEPNGITDSSYSITCGIQELKYALEKAGCTGPSDLTHIRLALQAYNFGAAHGITATSITRIMYCGIITSLMNLKIHHLILDFMSK